MKYLFALAIFCCVIGCNKPTETSDSRNQNRTTSVANIYPHSKAFKKTSLHGQRYLADTSTCLQCHGTDYKGGNARVSCYSCHSSFPHSTGWASPGVHGSAFLKLETAMREQCLNCHRPKPEAPANSITCAGCHAAYPHSNEFMTGDHAEWARQYSGQCTICHIDFKKHMPNFPNGCIDCHTGELKIQWIEKTSDGEKKPQKSGAIFKKNQATQSSRAR